MALKGGPGKKIMGVKGGGGHKMNSFKFCSDSICDNTNDLPDCQKPAFLMFRKFSSLMELKQSPHNYCSSFIWLLQVKSLVFNSVTYCIA